MGKISSIRVFILCLHVDMRLDANASHKWRLCIFFRIYTYIEPRVCVSVHRENTEKCLLFRVLLYFEHPFTLIENKNSRSHLHHHVIYNKKQQILCTQAAHRFVSIIVLQTERAKKAIVYMEKKTVFVSLVWCNSTLFFVRRSFVPNENPLFMCGNCLQQCTAILLERNT